MIMRLGSVKCKFRWANFGGFQKRRRKSSAPPKKFFGQTAEICLPTEISVPPYFGGMPRGKAASSHAPANAEPVSAAPAAAQPKLKKCEYSVKMMTLILRAANDCDYAARVAKREKGTVVDEIVAALGAGACAEAGYETPTGPTVISYIDSILNECKSLTKSGVRHCSRARDVRPLAYALTVLNIMPHTRTLHRTRADRRW